MQWNDLMKKISSPTSTLLDSKYTCTSNRINPNFESKNEYNAPLDVLNDLPRSDEFLEMVAEDSIGANRNYYGENPHSKSLYDIRSVLSSILHHTGEYNIQHGTISILLYFPFFSFLLCLLVV